MANDNSSLVFPNFKFPSSKSNCTILNKWHVISVTWSNGKNPSNCSSNDEKLVTFKLVTLRVLITALLATLV